MKKIFSNITREWDQKTTLQKIEKMLSYTILGALILAVVPAITLQMQLAEFQKTLVEQNLERCEQKVFTTSISPMILEESEIDPDDFFPAAPAETESVGLVSSYFDAFNRNDMSTACDIIDKSRCNTENSVDIRRFESLRKNMVSGYENVHLWMSDTAEGFHSDVVCVQYDYTYKNDRNAKKVTELLSYYVKDDAITARVCEKMTFDGEIEVPCPILSKTDFCL